MKLILNNKSIESNAEGILLQLKKEITLPYLNMIGHKKGDYVSVQCPWHKGGQESHMSCSVFASDDNPRITFGTCHCFTCGEVHSLPYLVGTCFGKDEEFGKEWLIERFGNVFVEKEEFMLPDISFDEQTDKYLDESILDAYAFYHPYMFKRHLTREVINKFKIGYDKETDSITFPTWDEHNRLVSINRRSVTGKNYQLQGNTEKPVYLLNFIKKEKIDTVMVCEAQFNALTGWTWGIPAIALMGTGTKYQYNILKKSGIRNYILALDGDDAGDKGNARFIKSMPDDCTITVVELPRGKDINDISFEEYQSLEKLDKYDWMNKHPLYKHY